MTPQPARDSIRVPSENVSQTDAYAIEEAKKFFWIAIAYVIVLLVFGAGVSFLLWNQKNFTIAYVPVAILQWSFIGGLVAVLYRAAYKLPNEDASIRVSTWIIVKPIIGMVMGAIIYFLAVSGELFLNGRTEIRNTEFLNVIAFVGGFSDRLSINLIDRLVNKWGPQ